MSGVADATNTVPGPELVTARILLVLVSLVASVLIGLALAARGGSATGKARDDGIVIGLSMDTLKEARWQADRDMFVRRAGELGAKVLVLAANSDDTVQVSDVEKLRVLAICADPPELSDPGQATVRALVAGQTGLELHWLLLVAVLISSLGAVMDVALSLASSLHELREADGKMSGLQLFAAGMRIGRDMIGTMSNTLILAFAGEAVTTLLLLMAYGWHSSQLFASDYAAIQVAQGVASTLGVVLGVPITSGICAALYRPLKR